MQKKSSNRSRTEWEWGKKSEKRRRREERKAKHLCRFLPHLHFVFRSHHRYFLPSLLALSLFLSLLSSSFHTFDHSRYNAWAELTKIQPPGHNTSYFFRLFRLSLSQPYTVFFLRIVGSFRLCFSAFFSLSISFSVSTKTKTSDRETNRGRKERRMTKKAQIINGMQVGTFTRRFNPIVNVRVSVSLVQFILAHSRLTHTQTSTHTQSHSHRHTNKLCEWKAQRKEWILFFSSSSPLSRVHCFLFQTVVWHQTQSHCFEYTNTHTNTGKEERRKERERERERKFIGSFVCGTQAHLVHHECTLLNTLQVSVNKVDSRERERKNIYAWIFIFITHHCHEDCISHNVFMRKTWRH